MTTNQLKRLEIELNREINAAKNAETARSNRANERLTEARDLRDHRIKVDTNRITGLHYQSQDSEAVRANRAKESETERANRAKEYENYRSNKARERETARSNMVNESERERSNRANEGLAAERNVVASDQAYNQLIANRNANRIAERNVDLAQDRLDTETALRERALDIQQEELDWNEAKHIEDRTWNAIQSAAKTGIQVTIPW